MSKFANGLTDEEASHGHSSENNFSHVATEDSERSSGKCMTDEEYQGRRKIEEEGLLKMKRSSGSDEY
ncbi:hypothetical protein L195_g016757 [Trifolium pratense]|uniref:Uncharacterized protein n=1 Tax=Trifolium pratense TaxID=57577 RepID=A0A2K3MS75_TRIPR|nr:hypothetical protein L195_g016757 [Trifolium pratense]